MKNAPNSASNLKNILLIGEHSFILAWSGLGFDSLILEHPTLSQTPTEDLTFIQRLKDETQKKLDQKNYGIVMCESALWDALKDLFPTNNLQEDSTIWLQLPSV